MTMLRFLKSFSLVFPCRNEKPRTDFYILENNTISTYHELNLSRFWGPCGKNVNWKITRKYDICILKYWWSLKALHELQIKWNGSVLNLDHSLILQIKLYQIDKSLLSFALLISKVHFSLLRALLSANLRLLTLVSVFENFLEWRCKSGRKTTTFLSSLYRISDLNMRGVIFRSMCESSRGLGKKVALNYWCEEVWWGNW